MSQSSYLLRQTSCLGDRSSLVILSMRRWRRPQIAILAEPEEEYQLQAPRQEKL